MFPFKSMLIAALVLLQPLAVSAKAETWKELLARAESLFKTERKDSALVFGQLAVERAEIEFGTEDTLVARVLSSLGALCEESVIYREAENFYLRALAIREKILGPESIDAAGSLNNLAILYQAQGRYSEADTLYKRALEIKEKVHGREAPDVATVLNNMASNCCEWRKYSEAGPLSKRALAISEKTLGPEHPEVATSLTNLATVYHSQGKYSEAAPLAEKALAIREKALGPEHVDVAKSLNNVAAIHIYQGKYADAEPQCKRAIAIMEKACGTEHPDVLIPLNTLALLYLYQGKFSDADPLRKRALVIAEKTLGPEHPTIVMLLINLAASYIYQGRYSEAESLLKRAIAINENAGGVACPELAVGLNNLASIYTYQGKYSQAEPLLKKGLALAEKALGPEHPQLAMSLNNLAMIYIHQRKYSQAEPLLKKGLALSEKALGSEHPDVAKIHINLATICTAQGNYSEAEPLYEEALARAERTLGPDHTDVASSLNNLAAIYTHLGKYSAAERAYKRALAINEKTLGPDHQSVAASLNNLAALYGLLGRYSDAEPIYRRALTISEKALGPEHRNVAANIVNLANLYQEQEEYSAAEELYNRALAIYEKTLGPEHAEVAATLGGLALLYHSRHKYSEAEPLCKRALAVSEKAFGPEHPEVANHLNNLASIYMCEGEYADAAPLLRRALAISERVFGPEHPDVANHLESMTALYLMQNNPGLALAPAARASGILQRHFQITAMALSEEDALKYSRRYRRSVNKYISCFLALESSDGSAASELADAICSSKGGVSDEVFERRKSLAQEADSSIMSLEQHLKGVRFQLAGLFAKGPGKDIDNYRDEIDSITTLADELDSELSLKSASYRRNKDCGKVRAARIASFLPQESILIEYIAYDCYEYQPDAVIPHYLALVIDRSGVVLIKDLGGASGIDSLVGAYGTHIYAVSKQNHAPVKADKEEYARIARKLYSKIVKPLDNHISSGKLLIIAPDGALNMISFAGLIDESGRYLVERNPIHYLSAGRDVIRMQYQDEPGQGLIAMGDPDYDCLGIKPAQYASPLRDPHERRNARPDCDDLRSIIVARLPRTRNEVGVVERLWKRESKEPAELFLGSEATEDNFKTEAPGKRVMHIATHAYYLDGACNRHRRNRGLRNEEKYLGENPLLLSGLFLAGANRRGMLADSLGTEDGIVTAYEVSTMDLRGTDLVVLSACETARGEIKTGEGVYGLRRAFQLAGARTIVSALWPVPDESTASMMAQLYRRSNQSLPKRIHHVQLAQIKKLRMEGSADHPYRWAGFVSIGDWK